eukprot:TRINITY_DN73071_c0_g1_i1.p1 TRINITY_DN73071_c0_g1~~TRINITY_DN73071_c0_g1_i1.p1  ORF type:complete len:332 (+),score=31.92 TRINITY_DN73071_c0_g1_i1:71-1066(+)
MSDVSIGYLCCLISVLGFGSNYIPVKKIDVKDGVFFTLCLSCGVFLVGLFQWAAFGFYKFEPFAMLGGAIWAVANACVPFIIERCGLGIGQLVWSVTNMLTGWATGTFGLFGKDRDTVQYFGLNCVGVVIAVLSLAPFALMEKDKPPEQSARDVEQCGDARVGLASAAPSAGASGFVAGFIVALVAGVFMGSNFDPPTYLQQIGPPEHSSDAMDYVISHFSGILLASLAYFLVYLGVMRKQSFYDRKIVLPGLGSGILWGIAQVGWFKANGALSYVIAFPIIVAVPGVLAAVWGVVLFGENRGRRNLSLLTSVILIQIVGVGIIAMSKGKS